MHAEVRPLWDTRSHLASKSGNYQEPSVDKCCHPDCNRKLYFRVVAGSTVRNYKRSDQKITNPDIIKKIIKSKMKKLKWGSPQLNHSEMEES